MNLENFFAQLSRVELSNISAGNKGAGSIAEKNQAGMVVLINDGLKALYRKFSIREKHFIIEPIEGHDRYTISLDHAVSQDGVTAGPHYIVDTVDDPFDDDVLQFIEAVDSEGNDYVFNDSTRPRSIHTPEPDVLQIPYAKEGVTIAIGYLGKPTELIDCDGTQLIDLPDSLIPALRAHVAAAFFGPINTTKAQEAHTYNLLRYEDICRDIQASNILMQDRTHIGDRFDNNGWV